MQLPPYLLSADSQGWFKVTQAAFVSPKQTPFPFKDLILLLQHRSDSLALVLLYVEKCVFKLKTHRYVSKLNIDFKNVFLR